MNTPVQPVLRPQTQPIPLAEWPDNSAPLGRMLRDSMRTHFILLRFCTTSLAAATIDNLVFYLVFRATGTILGAQIAARTISVFFNYRLVRHAVFFSDRRHHTLLPRYLALAILNAAISYGGIRLLSGLTPLNVIASKILTETLLFAANFTIQRMFIFTRRPLAASRPDASAGL